MDTSQRTTFFLISLTILLHSQTSPRTAFSAESIIFRFPPFFHNNLTLAGNSSLRNGSLWLTDASCSCAPKPSSGAALFCLPIELRRSDNLSSSFSSSVEGNELVFFITPKSSIPDPLDLSPQAVQNKSILFLEFSGTKSLDAKIHVEHIGGGGMKSVSLWAGEPGLPILTERQPTTSDHFVEHICAGFFAYSKNSSEALLIATWNLSASTNHKDQYPTSTSLVIKVLRVIFCTLLVLLFLIVACLKAQKILEKFCKWLRSRAPPAPTMEELQLQNFQGYKLREIQEAMKKILDEGRTSFVYHMVLPDVEEQLAVKRFKLEVRAREAYSREVAVMCRVQHENILELKGWCCERDAYDMLIYKYIEKGNLHSALRDEANIFI